MLSHTFIHSFRTQRFSPAEPKHRWLAAGVSLCRQNSVFGAPDLWPGGWGRGELTVQRGAKPGGRLP